MLFDEDYYVIDDDHPDRFDPEFFECTKPIEIGHGISWRFYKHWGQGYLAGQGCTMRHGDRSGCIHFYNNLPCVNVPMVVQARLYTDGQRKVSAVLSYPKGLSSIMNGYFWEIYDYEHDVERFYDETEMEQRIIEILTMKHLEESLFGAEL